MLSSKTIRKLAAIGLASIWLSAAVCAQAPPRMQPGEGATNRKPSILDQVGIEQRLNQQVPLNLTFTDENGNAVKLGQYFGSKPVILSLVYFQCPMLCSQVLNGLAGTMNGIVRFNAGRDFEVVTVSFDPRDTPKNAADNKRSYLSRYRRAGAAEGWHFLTGSKDQIDALASAVGFHYAWDQQAQQFAHASGIMLATPDGRLAQYYYGIEYAPRDVQLGLIEASQGKIGNVVDQLVLYCYHYDPTQGRYGAVIFNILRLSALATVLLLGGFLIVMFRRDILEARQAARQRHFSGVN
jgi:protein SCO1/2